MKRKGNSETEKKGRDIEWGMRKEEEGEREKKWRKNEEKMGDRGKDRETEKKVFIKIDTKRENVATWPKCFGL